MGDIKRTKWERFWLNPWFGGFVLCAMAAMVCFFQTDAYVAEKTGSGLWWFLGGILAVAAVWFLKKTNDTSTGTGG